MKLVNIRIGFTYNILGVQYGSEVVKNVDCEFTQENVIRIIEELKLATLQSLRDNGFYRVKKESYIIPKPMEAAT